MGKKSISLKIANVEDTDKEDSVDEGKSETLSCTYHGALTLNKKVKLLKNVCPDNTYYFNGSLRVNESFSLNEGVIFILFGSVFYNHDLKLAENSQLNISGSVFFNGKVSLEEGATITVNGSPYLP
ncbi:hypothetical protein [Oceanobacillus picturae]|uniref:hypothetical protein n=1 Tax=Oceanobacillus picturae TaxID=171693 RepID=UPI00363DC37C